MNNAKGRTMLLAIALVAALTTAATAGPALFALCLTGFCAGACVRLLLDPGRRRRRP